MTRRSPLLLAVPLGALALAGCADPAAEDPAAGLAGAAPDTHEYQVSATVLESPEHGPQLCHGINTSLPPQCEGPDVVGWDWEAVEHESASGTRWGAYLLVGTWDGERFTPTEPPAPPDHPGSDPAEPDYDTSPCPEPDGGWQPADPATATQEALDEALTRAASADDYAGSWLDQSYLDELGEDAELEEVANDPARLVLNLQFTGDLAEREQWIREVWGGALCVSGADRTEAELLDVQQRLHEDMPDILGSGIDTHANTVTAQVYVATPELQQQLDADYGEGRVILEGWLQPV